LTGKCEPCTREKREAKESPEKEKRKRPEKKKRKETNAKKRKIEGLAMMDRKRRSKKGKSCSTIHPAVRLVDVLSF